MLFRTFETFLLLSEHCSSRHYFEDAMKKARGDFEKRKKEYEKDDVDPDEENTKDRRDTPSSSDPPGSKKFSSVLDRAASGISSVPDHAPSQAQQQQQEQEQGEDDEAGRCRLNTSG